jgi:hypothetical protein
VQSSPNIIKTTKPKTKRWAQHVICTKKKNTNMVFIQKPKGKIPLTWYICEKNIKTGEHVLDSSGPRQGGVEGCYERGNEPSDFTSLAVLLA